MAGDDMSAQFVAQSQGRFEVQGPAFVPHARYGAPHAFGGDIHGEPGVAFRSAALHDGQAYARTGDRCTDCHFGRIEGTGDAASQIAALLGFANFADGGDDTGKHGKS